MGFSDPKPLNLLRFIHLKCTLMLCSCLLSFVSPYNILFWTKTYLSQNLNALIAIDCIYRHSLNCSHVSDQQENNLLNYVQHMKKIKLKQKTCIFNLKLNEIISQFYFSLNCLTHFRIQRTLNRSRNI